MKNQDLKGTVKLDGRTYHIECGLMPDMPLDEHWVAGKKYVAIEFHVHTNIILFSPELEHASIAHNFVRAEGGVIVAAGSIGYDVDGIWADGNSVSLGVGGRDIDSQVLQVFADQVRERVLKKPTPNR